MKGEGMDVREALAELVAATDPNGDTPVEGWKSAWRKASAVLSAQPAEPDSVPWPTVTSYSGGASQEGIGGRVWIRLSDEGPDVEYVPAPQPAPSEPAVTDEQIKRLDRQIHGGSDWDALLAAPWPPAKGAES